MCRIITIPLSLLLLATMLITCKKATVITDNTMISLAQNDASFSYYKNDTTRKVSVSQVHAAYIKMRYNSIATNALTDSGKLPVNSSFPEGSLIVKELYNTNNGNLFGYAILYKQPSDANAQAGWLWGEYGVSGNIKHSISQKCDGCITCHTTNARDYNKIFDLYP